MLLKRPETNIFINIANWERGRGERKAAFHRNKRDAKNLELEDSIGTRFENRAYIRYEERKGHK